MHFITIIFKPLEKLLNKLGICSTVGFMAGAITGFILFCYNLTNPIPPVLTMPELWKLAAMIWLFVFLVILFMLVIFCRFTLGSVFLQTLVNTLFSSMLTTFIVYKTNGWQWAFFIGAILGLLIGKIFCLICQYLNRG